MSWSREQVQCLIDSYKSKPCLYAVKTAIYKNKHARLAAWNEIYTVLKCVRPTTTINEIKNKVNSLRTNFLAEHRKITKSKTSGAGTDEIYTPALWYFDELFFILEYNTTRKSYDSISESTDGTEEVMDIMDLPVFSEEGCALSPTNFENHLNDNFESDSASPVETVFSPPTSNKQCLNSTSTIEPVASCSTPISNKRSQTSTGSVPIKKQKQNDNTEHLLKSASTTMNKIVEVMINKEKPIIEKKDSIQIFSDFVDSRIRLLNNAKIQNDVKEKITILLFDSYRKDNESM